MKPTAGLFIFFVFLATWKDGRSENRRGFLFTAPKRLLVDTTEIVCISLHNINEPGDIYIDILTPETDDKISTAYHRHTGGPEACIELYIPPTTQTRGRLHLRGQFDEVHNYTINMIKEIYIQHNPHLTFISTDKPVYKPGQDVKIRLLTLKHDLTPVKEQIPKVWIENPSEIRMAQWLEVETQEGLAQVDFQLSQEPVMGIWKIKTSRDNAVQTFEVKEYVLPKFEVIITPPNYILGDAEMLEWKICAKYSYGQPVKGDLLVEIEPKSWYGWGQPKLTPVNFNTKMDSKDGCYNFNISGSELGFKNSRRRPDTITFTSFVTEYGTGITQNATVESEVHRKAFKIDFNQYSSSHFKPGLFYKAKLRVQHLDGTPVPDEVIKICLNLRTETNSGRRLVDCQNFTTNRAGFVGFIVPPQEGNVTLLSFVAYALSQPDKKFELGSDWPLMMQQSKAYFDVDPWYSPSVSYLEIIDSQGSRLRCNKDHAVDIYYTSPESQKNISFYYVIKSRGDIRKIGHVTYPMDETEMFDPTVFPNILGSSESSHWKTRKIRKFPLNLHVTSLMSPVSYLLLYYIRENGEIVAASHKLKIDKCFSNQVKAKWSERQNYPGSRVNFQITALPQSLCAISAIDKSIEFLGTRNDISREDVFSKLDQYEIDESSVPSQADIMKHCSKGESPVRNNLDFWDLRRKRRFLSRSPWMQYTSNYVDAVQAFDDFGSIVMTDFTLESRPCERQFRSIQISDNDFMIMPYSERAGGVLVLSDMKLFTRPCVENSLHSCNPCPFQHSHGLRAILFGRTEVELPGLPGIADVQPMALPPQPMSVARTKDRTSYNSNSIPTTAVEIRTFFPETWLWDLVYIGKEGGVELEQELPHSITEWVGNTFCISQHAGLGISPPAHIKAFQPFFLDCHMPYSVKRGEVAHLKVSVFNYLSESLPVKLSFEDNNDIELLSEQPFIQTCIEDKGNFVHTFRIKPTSIGEINITVSAEVDDMYPEPCGPDFLISKRDVLIKPLRVEPEGFPVEVVKSSFVCPKDFAEDSIITWSLSLPADIVEDSARAQVSVIGDLLGPAIENLDNLVRLPMGCGEQNMILFVPNIHVINYLGATNQLSSDLKKQAIEHMKTGYQRELNYRHDDGSYSAFGNDDKEGSMWLTAFVVKSFAQARDHIFIDDEDLKNSMRWITKKQLENGCFPFHGQIFHKDLKGGLTSDSSPTGLTAYILIALLETQIEMSPSVVSNGLFCLKGEQDPDLYTLSLVTYAFTVMNETQLAEEYLERLLGLATRENDLLWWEKGANSLSLNVEITGYAILSLVKLGGEENMINALRAVRWISQQRNSQGGFVSTQDTVIALEAITKYATILSKDDVDLTVLAVASEFEETFLVRPENNLLYQRQHLPVLPTQVEIMAEGDGCALVQATLKYNVKTPKGSDAFSLQVTTEPVASVDHCTVQRLKLCMNYKLADGESNMAVVEVGMISGYMVDKLSLESLKQDESLNIKRWEEDKDKVNVYFESLSEKLICIAFLVAQESEVENPKPAQVKLYDYYQQELSISVEYILEDKCEFEKLPHPEPMPFDDIIEPVPIIVHKADEGSDARQPFAVIPPILNGPNRTSFPGISNVGEDSFPRFIRPTWPPAGPVIFGAVGEGLNPNFTNVDHELDVPDGIEGPLPVFVQGDESKPSCPRCLQALPPNFNDLYCNSKKVYKASIKKVATDKHAANVKILLDVSPGRQPAMIHKRTSLSVSEGCDCSPLQNSGKHILLLANWDDDMNEPPQVLHLTEAETIVQVPSRPGQPQSVKAARNTCTIAK